MLITLDKRNREESHAFLPCLVDFKCYHLGRTNFSQITRGVLSFTYHHLCHLSPSFPYPPVPISVPGAPLPLDPAEASSSSLAFAANAAAAAAAAQTRAQRKSSL